MERVKVLQSVCRYVSETNRFTRENINTKIFSNLNKEYSEIDNTDECENEESKIEKQIKEIEGIEIDADVAEYFVRNENNNENMNFMEYT